MTTRTEILTRYNVEVSLDDATAADIDVPVITGPQRQGDVALFPREPMTRDERAQATAVPPEGVAVVRGETGNTHMLCPTPTSPPLWLPNTTTGDVLLGVVEVDAAAWLIHTEEHQVLGVGRGTFEVRGKREQREVIARVQD